MHNGFENKNGNIVVSVCQSGIGSVPFFHVTSNNEIQFSSIVDIIEDTLKKY